MEPDSPGLISHAFFLGYLIELASVTSCTNVGLMIKVLIFLLHRPAGKATLAAL